MYDVRDYDAMFADGVRVHAYLEAIRRAVKPGDVVVEIGTGVGYFAVAACRAGARRVYAIEMNPAIGIAEQVAADNGCSDRITFIHDDSRRVELPERGNVLVSDLRGVLPLFSEHVPTLADARARLLHPDATLVPVRDTLWVAPCTAPTQWRRDHIEPGDAPHGIVRRSVAARIRMNWYRAWMDTEQLLAPGVQWAVLEYASIVSPTVAGDAEWTFGREGSVDGFALWFAADFGFDIAFSNAPGDPKRLYGQAFFPLERSLAVREGDRLRVELRAHLVQGDYVWAWNSAFTPSAAGAEHVGFQQSTLVSRLISLEYLRQRSVEDLARGAAPAR